MPRKKAKSAGGDKKKKKKEKQEPVLETELEKPPVENSREYFLVQIRDLEKQLGRYQEKCYDLEVGRKTEVDVVHQLQDEMNDRIDHYKKALIAKEGDIADWMDRAMGIRQERDSDKEMYEKQLAELRKKNSEDVSRLTHENTVLKNNLDALEEFKVKREEHERENKRLLEDLKRQEEQQKEVIYLLERKNVEDKNRLKNEISVKVNEMAAEFRRVSNKQMAETTKRTIRENVAMQEQLKKLSDKALELVAENDDLKQKDRENRRKIDLLEDQEKLMARKLAGLTENFAALTERCKDFEFALNDSQQRIAAFEEIQADREQLTDQVSGVREKMEELLDEREQLQAKLQETTDKLKSEKQIADRLRVVLSQCAGSVSSVLSEPLVGLSDEAAQMRATESRNSLLYALMNILGTAADLNLGPQFQSIKQQEPPKAWGDESSRTSLAASRAHSALREHLPEISQVLPHYQPGDLGIVPRDVPVQQESIRELFGGGESKGRAVPGQASKIRALEGLSKRARFQLIGHVKKSELEAAHRQLLSDQPSQKSTFPPVS